MLFVLDGSKALRKAVRSVFGNVPVQRCLWHYADPAFMPTRAGWAWRYRRSRLMLAA
jgi:transposase-like protein